MLHHTSTSGQYASKPFLPLIPLQNFQDQTVLCHKRIWWLRIICQYDRFVDIQASTNLTHRLRESSQVKSKLAGPKAAPLGRKQKQFKICRSSIMQNENYKIPPPSRIYPKFVPLQGQNSQILECHPRSVGPPSFHEHRPDQNLHFQFLSSSASKPALKLQ